MTHLRGRTADVVIDASFGVPVIVHWGAPLGDVDEASIGAALRRPVVAAALDVEAPLSTVPQHGDGYPGRPGLDGNRRGGRMWAPRFAPDGDDHVEQVDGGVVVHAIDREAELRLSTCITLDHVLRVACTLTNLGSNRYLLHRLHVTLPLPARASELLTFSGRWAREMASTRAAWIPGSCWSAEDRSGRSSHEHPALAFAGTPGFGEWAGEVWGVHLAWSGNHCVFAEALPDGRRAIQLGELLHPGEVALEPGETYSTPDVVGVWSPTGLTAASWGFHRAVRSASPLAGSARTVPRPVLLNTWEAVYFDHDPARLRELASVAASLGIERFVLDDGWFGGRRDDQRALGDWHVSPDAHPDGLAPLIAHVRELGMSFGIWVEPEMMSPDSELCRAHPDWVLATDGYEQVLGRHQLVLDLACPGAFEHVMDHLDRLLTDHDIEFLKWDMNRPLAQASGADGVAGARAQLLAYRRLVDEVRRRHPHVEIESCASGGGRIDHDVLRRVERVWTSDCNDALERQSIQRGMSSFIPPEVMGAHIGPTRSHTTGRSHSLAFRALTAMFGHLGVEWDVTRLDDAHREALASVIALHRRFRPLLHGGDVVRFDLVPDGADSSSGASGWAHGVYATDRSEALVAYIQLRTGASQLPPPLTLPGLDPDATYALDEVPLPGAGLGGRAPLSLQLTGRQLAAHGLQLPVLHPESGLLLHLVHLKGGKETFPPLELPIF